MKPSSSTESPRRSKASSRHLDRGRLTRAVEVARDSCLSLRDSYPWPARTLLDEIASDLRQSIHIISANIGDAFYFGDYHVRRHWRNKLMETVSKLEQEANACNGLSRFHLALHAARAAKALKVIHV